MRVTKGHILTKVLKKANHKNLNKGLASNIITKSFSQQMQNEVELQSPQPLPAHAGRPRAAKSVPMKISSNGKSSNENDERIMCQVSLMTPVCPDLVTFQNFGKNFKIIGKSTYLGKFSVG